MNFVVLHRSGGLSFHLFWLLFQCIGIPFQCYQTTLFKDGSMVMMMVIKIVAHHGHYHHGPLFLGTLLIEADDGEYDYVL